MSMREDFEEWVVGRTFFKKIGAHLKQNSDGSYGCYAVNDRWLAWQAALSRQAAQGGEAVAKVGRDFQLLYTRQDWSAGLKYGSLLYAAPPDTVPRAELQAAIDLNEGIRNELADITAELEQFRKDAERYGWLRDEAFTNSESVSKDATTLFASHGQPFDETIDRAMQEGK